MKYIITSILLSFSTLILGQYDLDLTFKKYKNNENVTSFSFDDKIMDYVKNKDKEWKTNIDKVEIIVLGPDQDFEKSDLEKINKAIKADNYEMLINAKSKDGKAAIYGLTQPNNEALTSLYAQVYSEEATVYFMLKGNIFFEELAEMGLNFQGADIFKGM